VNEPRRGADPVGACAIERRNEWRDALRRGLRRGKYAMGHHPVTLPILLRLTPEGRSRAIDEETDVVVEGFPRSGNTFATFALRHADRHLRVVSHVHHPNQVVLAVRRGLPTILVVREPVPTLASYLIAGPHGRARGVLEEYVAYHRELLPYLPDVLVVDFAQLSTDMGLVIDRLNARYGTSITRFEHTREEEAAVFASVEQFHLSVHGVNEGLVPRPSQDRRDANERHRAELRSPALSPLLREAEEVHHVWQAVARA
jgi:hypothetical protein